jgi:hypothetical protein
VLRAAVLAAGFWVGACARDVTGDIEAIADRACACKDAACARAAVADLVALAKRDEIVRGDEARAGAAARKLAQCALANGVTRIELEAAIPTRR